MKFRNTPIALALISALTAIPSYAAEENNEAEADISRERIVVTGSRIARINTQSASPIVSVDSAAIEASGILNMNDLLTQMPQFAFGVGTASSNQDGFSNAGLNAANLRNLGTDRTLTLINGRRVVQSTWDTGLMVTDTSYIPTALIERVDVLTGGAASTYGADAVAGVVNYVMKKDYEGTKISSQYGESDVGDGKEKSINITTGHNFNNDKGNVVFSYDYYNQGRANRNNRPGSGTTRWIDNPLSSGTGDGQPNEIIGTNLGWPDYNIVGQMMGVFNAADDRIDYFDITGNESIYRFNSNDRVDPFYLQNSANAEGYELDTYAMTRNPYERNTAYLLFNYELSDTLKLTTDLRYTNVKSDLVNSPEYNYGLWYVNIDNFSDAISLPDHVNTLLAQDDGWFQTSVGLDELGPRGTEVERELYAFTATLEGEFSNGWLWDAYVSSGVSTNDSKFYNNTDKRRLGRWAFETNSDTGEVCDNNNCPAFNPLVPMSPEAMDYVRLDPYGSQIESEQHMFAFTVSGDVVELPYGALAFAAGVEVRRESLDMQVDETWQDIDISGTERLPWQAGKTIQEIFVEVEAPVIADVFLIDELVLSAAGRTSDYTYAGRNNTWKLGATWSIVEGLAMRTTYAHTVRAPQLVEQFGAPSTGWSRGVDDPCDQNEIANAPTADQAQIISNCQALGIEDPENWEAATHISGGIFSTSGGNINLKPEQADTLTVGIGYTPSFIDNLSLTLDYYDIDLEDAMEQPGLQTTLNNCVRAEDMESNVYCSFVERGSDSNVTDVLSTTVNQGLRTRRGVDMEVSYLQGFESYGELSVSLYVTKLIKSTYRNAAGSDEVDVTGIYGSNAEVKSRLTLTYSYEDLNVNWITNYAEGVQVHEDGTYDLYDKPFSEDAIQHDARVSYNVTDNANVYLGVRNVFDNTYYDHPYTAAGVAQYDAMGRFFYGGFTYEF